MVDHQYQIGGDCNFVFKGSAMTQEKMNMNSFFLLFEPHFIIENLENFLILNFVFFANTLSDLQWQC